MLLNLAIVLVAGYAVLVLLLFVFQARLVYYPEVGRGVSATPLAAGLEFEDVWLDVAPDVASDVRLHAWYVPHAQAKSVVLILHGNAGSIASRIDWLRMFHGLGYASLIVDYRGYGRSTGAPSEAGTYEDADAAWRHLTQSRGWPAQDVVIVGESLGGAIAAHLASRVTPRALVLQSAFTSVPDLAAQIYPWMPIRWINRFEYATLARLGEVSAPVLIAHSRDDELIGFSHGRALYAAARDPKRFVELRGGHNDAALFVRDEWVGALGEFLESARGR